MASASVVSNTGYADNWQSGKSLAECNLHMLTTEMSCDVIFRVGKQEEIIRAHRYVLISRSCVFHAMLCGPLAEKDDIKIPEVETDIFRELLKFLYTDLSNPTQGNVTGLLYLAKKYAVGDLERHCLKYLEESLSVENACVILEQAHVFDEKLLFDSALKVILENAETCFCTQSFKELSHDCFHKVMSSDDLTVKPEQMFTAAVTWAEEECRRQEREITPVSLRSVIGQTLYAIPLQDMDKNCFVNQIVPQNILTNEENVAVMSCMLCPEKDPAPFTRRLAKRSLGGKLDIVFYDGYRRWTGKRHADYICDKLHFICCQDILIHGVYILGTSNRDTDNGSDMYQISFGASDQPPFMNKTLPACSDTELHDDRIVAVYLDEPVTIIQDVEHYVFVQLTGQGQQEYVGKSARSSITAGECKLNIVSKMYIDIVSIIYGFIVRV